LKARGRVPTGDSSAGFTIHPPAPGPGIVGCSNLPRRPSISDNWAIGDGWGGNP
jgi:hypothetical protein